MKWPHWFISYIHLSGTLFLPWNSWTSSANIHRSINQIYICTKYSCLDLASFRPQACITNARVICVKAAGYTSTFGPKHIKHSFCSGEDVTIKSALHCVSVGARHRKGRNNKTPQKTGRTETNVKKKKKKYWLCWNGSYYHEYYKHHLPYTDAILRLSLCFV